MDMNYVTEPIRNPIGGLQILNWAVAPTDLANQYQQWEPVHRLSPRHGFSWHRSRPNQVSAMLFHSFLIVARLLFIDSAILHTVGALNVY